MKKLNFLAFLVAIAFVSCAKSDAPTPTTAFVAPKPSIELTNSCANEAQNFFDVSDKSLTLNDGTTFLRFDKTSQISY